MSRDPIGSDVDIDPVLDSRCDLIELTIADGPELLAEQARLIDEATCRESLRAYLTREDTASPASFFARVLLQPMMFGNRQAASQLSEALDAPLRPQNTGGQPYVAACPDCGHDPQVACLRVQGDGSALSLICSLCLREWPFSRLRCPSCGESDHHKISFYASPQWAHMDVQVCDTCRTYLHLVNCSKDSEAVPDVDEMAALALDVWANENGYCKIHANLLGI